jgi:hypothetical protein
MNDRILPFVILTARSVTCRGWGIGRPAASIAISRAPAGRTEDGDVLHHRVQDHRAVSHGQS